jgi:hypothetical protein
MTCKAARRQHVQTRPATIGGSLQLTAGAQSAALSAALASIIFLRPSFLLYSTLNGSNQPNPKFYH